MRVRLCDRVLETVGEPETKEFFVIQTDLIFCSLLNPSDEGYKIRKTDLLPFLIPACMYLFGGTTLLYTLLMWGWIVFFSSFHFGVVGLNAAHHHPNIFHDGDTPRYDSSHNPNTSKHTFLGPILTGVSTSWML